MHTLDLTSLDPHIRAIIDDGGPDEHEINIGWAESEDAWNTLADEALHDAGYRRIESWSRDALGAVTTKVVALQQ